MDKFVSILNDIVWNPGLVVLLLFAVMLPLLANAETQNGTCGDNVTWTLDEDRVLTIRGSGKITDTSSIGYGNYSALVIEEGITEICSYAFQSRGFYQVTLPSSLENIGVAAFSHNNLLINISIPSGIQIINSTFPQAFLPENLCIIR
jgi:hypothetical protein